MILRLPKVFERQIFCGLFSDAVISSEYVKC
jgi:hypothetical protein